MAFVELGRRDITEDNEGQRATPPVEMIRNGQYIIPTINDKDYLSKPPLIYWMIVAAYTVSGRITETVARTPAALCYILLVLSVYMASRREAGERAALWSALAVMASPYVVDRGRYAELDIPLTLATFLAIVAFRAACHAETARRTAVWTVVSGVMLGAGVLLKGPVPFLFLSAAWLAMTIIAGSPERWLRQGIVWIGALFGLGIVLWLIAVLPGVRLRVPFPVALALMAGLWVVLAWRHGGPHRGRYLTVFLLAMAIGIAVAAPWAAAVLWMKGWVFVDRLLHSEVLERTHTASRINSGSPFYYFLGILGMAAPWALLLPCQASRRLWNEGGAYYRFSILTGWMSVIVFSLIAGKEYEYILPGIPFLLIGVGIQLAAFGEAAPDWTERWTRLWRDAVPLLLAVMAAVCLVLVVQRNKPMYLASGAITAILLGVYAITARPAQRRFTCIAGASLCVVLLWTFSQNYRYMESRSMKSIAVATGDLVRAGHHVEAVKMTQAFDLYPGFAFYTRAAVPAVAEAEAVRALLEGPEPCYCVLRQEQVKALNPPLPDTLAQPLFGPCTKRGLVILGNRPLPPSSP